MAESAPTVASPGATSAPGQAATPAQQGAVPADQQPPQGGQAATPPAEVPAQGQQGSQPGSTQQPETPAAPAPPPVVPERYDIRLPEGSLLDQSDVETVAALAKTHQWTNEQAQETLTEMHTRITAQATAFRAELDADPELGGGRLEESQALALRVLDRFLPASHPDGARLRSTFNRTGYGNFKPLVRLLAGIGKAMREDQPHAGSATAPALERRSAAERLFGDAQGVKPPS